MKTDGLAPTLDSSQIPPFIKAISKDAENTIAAFDADGTLWVNDVADDFTQWMIDRGSISDELWETYLRIYRDDPPTGCRYLLRLYEGMELCTLARAVEVFWSEAGERSWVSEVIAALKLLQKHGYPIWIVSGTPTEFLLPLVPLLGVDAIVGMDFEIVDGRITGKHRGIPCAGQGKAEKMLSLLGPRKVRFCAGNGSLDGPMMQLAEVAWSVYPDPDFATYSKAQGWPILPRPADFIEEEKFLLGD